MKTSFFYRVEMVLEAHSNIKLHKRNEEFFNL